MLKWASSESIQNKAINMSLSNDIVREYEMVERQPNNSWRIHVHFIEIRYIFSRHMVNLNNLSLERGVPAAISA